MLQRLQFFLSLTSHFPLFLHHSFLKNNSWRSWAEWSSHHIVEVLVGGDEDTGASQVPPRREQEQRVGGGKTVDVVLAEPLGDDAERLGAEEDEGVILYTLKEFELE